MARVPDVELERLKSQVSIQRLAEARGVELKRHGADLIGLCPFHDDKKPSLVIPGSSPRVLFSRFLLSEGTFEATFFHKHPRLDPSPATLRKGIRLGQVLTTDDPSKESWAACDGRPNLRSQIVISWRSPYEGKSGEPGGARRGVRTEGKSGDPAPRGARTDGKGE